MADHRECDVVVIGGGPAGSTISALLARAGKRTVVLEKERFPRFHIGESLLPLNLPLFDRLGVADDVHRIGVYKPGAELISDAHNAATTFRFADNPCLSIGHSYQVRRSEFDKVLLDNSRRLGAEVIEGARVTEVDLNGGRQAVSQAMTERRRGRPGLSSMHPDATRCWRIVSASSASINAIIPPRCSVTSAMFRAGPATRQE
jgi:Dehydrogenases (flavoproteins)